MAAAPPSETSSLIPPAGPSKHGLKESAEDVVHKVQDIEHSAEHSIHMALNRMTCGLHLLMFGNATGLDSKLNSLMTPAMHAAWLVEDAVRLSPRRACVRRATTRAPPTTHMHAGAQVKGTKPVQRSPETPQRVRESYLIYQDLDICYHFVRVQTPAPFFPAPSRLGVCSY